MNILIASHWNPLIPKFPKALAWFYMVLSHPPSPFPSSHLHPSQFLYLQSSSKAELFDAIVFALLLVKNGEIFGDCNGKLPKGKAEHAEQNDWMVG